MGKKVVAVIPVFGRLPLLKYTIKRLLEKNGVHDVVCVAETQEEFNVIHDNGAHVVIHENKPLGKKWNAGFQYARSLNPDVIVFVGSSDWLSDNWIPTMLPHMDEFDMIGKKDFTMMDIGYEPIFESIGGRKLEVSHEEQIRMCYWFGYGEGKRKDEPIGIGRMVSARILDKIDWKPFDDTKDNSMDWQMYQKVIEQNGAIGLIEDDTMIALSVSTNRWPNMHKFEDHWNDLVPSKSARINNMEPYFTMFPEYKDIFK
jgi:glycosyltransferase involved in cell wall biosynthesis